MSSKKSGFIVEDVIPSGSFFDYFGNGQNRRTSKEALFGSIQAFLNPLNLVIQNVTSPYLVSDSDTNTFLVFNDAGTADVSIPDNLKVGVNFAYTNKGAGAVQIVLTGVDTLRGAALVTDLDGYAAVTKIDLTTWQTSER